MSDSAPIADTSRQPARPATPLILSALGNLISSLATPCNLALGNLAHAPAGGLVFAVSAAHPGITVHVPSLTDTLIMLFAVASVLTRLRQ